MRYERRGAEWRLSERELVQTSRAGAPVRIAWEDVAETAFSALGGHLRVRGRDGTEIRVDYRASYFGLLVLELERALSRRAHVRLPAVIPRDPTPRAARWALALTVGLAAGALVTSGGLQVGLGLAAATAVLLPLAIWATVRERASVVVELDHVTVRQGWGTTRLPLDELRQWAVTFKFLRNGSGTPVLVLATENDSWEWTLSPTRWRDVAAALRAASERHPQLAWLGTEPLRAYEQPAPSTPAPERTSWRSWRWGVGMLLAAAVVTAAAMTAARPTHPTEHARLLMEARLPGWGVGLLAPWLEQRPDDLEAHRAFVDAHVRACDDPRHCGSADARRYYEALGASGDPRHAQIARWALARLDGALDDRAAAIVALAELDPAIVPDAPVDRAELLIEEGRLDEAAHVLTSLRVRSAAADRAYARLLVTRGAVDELASFVREVGADRVDAGAWRALAAHQLELSSWAAVHAWALRAAPLSIVVALAFGLAWLALARFWSGPRAPSWPAALCGALVGAALFAAERFAVDAIALGGPVLGSRAASVAVSVLARAAIPMLLALAWERASSKRLEPLRLVSRAGILAAGIGAAWSAVRIADRGLAADIATAWMWLPLETLTAPWAALWLVDLRRRGWSAAGASVGAIGICGLLLGPFGAVVAIVPRPFGGMVVLAALVAVLWTFRLLLWNAATLDEHASGARTCYGAGFAVSVAVVVGSFVASTRVLPAGHAALSHGLTVLFALLLVPATVVSCCGVKPLSAWRRDFWRERPTD